MAIDAYDLALGVGANLAYQTYMAYGKRKRSGSGSYGSKRRRYTRGGRVNYRRTRYGGAKTRSGSGVTTQYNATTQYRKHRMPAYKRKKWSSFIRRVNAVQLKAEGTRQVVYNNTLNIGASSGEQAITSIALYGGKGLSEYGALRGYDDIARCFGQNVTTEQITNSSSIHFESAVLDVTIRNQSATEYAEVDIYEVWSYGDHTHQRTDGPEPDNTSVESLEQAIDDATKNMTSMTAPPQLSKRGTTPFDIGQAFKQYRLEIKSKRKYLINPKQAITYQMRDPRTHVVNRAYFLERRLWSLRKLTKMILIVGKAVVNSDEGAGECDLDIGHTRHYAWKNILKNESAGGYV